MSDKQVPFDLPFCPAHGRADFLRSDSNAAALAAIERWPEWPTRVLVLHGPAGSGKSHLADVWRRHTGGTLIAGERLELAAPDELAGMPAVAIDDAERAPERTLLHLHNCCVEAGTGLLLVARPAPAHWPFVLPDLASRLRAAASVAIAQPDDALLAAMLVKHFADRQVRVGPGVIDCMMARIERSFAGAAAAAACVDRLSLSVGRPITVPLARRALSASAEDDYAGDDQSELPSDFAVT